MEKQSNSNRTSISLPRSLVNRLDEHKSPRQAWAGVVEELLDEVEQ